MSNLSAHTARCPFRHIIAAGITALYLAMIFSPLAPFAMQSTGTAPVVVRECSGDCDLCGCSPESRASHTCCCARKNQQQAHAHDDHRDAVSDCCTKESAPQKPVIISCGCPCGDGEQSALTIAGTSEVLPFRFTEKLTIPATTTAYSNLTQRLTSRIGEPPDPPPQNS